MKIGIIGYGIVGKAADLTFSQKFDTVKYDKFINLDKFENLVDCDYIFIMVPTPYDYNLQKADYSAVEESLVKIQELRFRGNIVIKSTMTPGKCDDFSKKYDVNIIYNPEFLRESISPNEDFKNQEIVVIGTPDKETFNNLKKMYKSLLIPNAKYFHTSLREAEMIKLSQNTMLASRVAIANMIFDACDENQIDYNVIREIAFDNFEIIGPHMSLVPGPDGKRGFGGKCLPKDTLAFSKIINSELLNTLIKYNESLRDDLNSVINNYEKENE